MSFKYRRFFMHFSTKLRIELSDNDGASYTTIGTIDGTNPSGTSTDWDSNFITTSIAIPAAFLDTSIRLRFRLDATGSTFLGSEDNRGIYIDDIAVSNSIQLLSPSVIALDSGTTSFGLTPSTPGEQYFLQVRPKHGDHWFGYGDPLAVAAVSPPPAPSSLALRLRQANKAKSPTTRPRRPRGR